MSLVSHYSRGDLESYFEGSLDESAGQSLLRHLGDCDQCMDLSHDVWAGLSPLLEGWPEPEPEPDQGEGPDRARLESRTLRRIHLSHLLGDSITLMIHGFGVVLAALLEPFGTTRSDNRKGKYDDV